jgi:hypothetical protein
MSIGVTQDLAYRSSECVRALSIIFLGHTSCESPSAASSSILMQIESSFGPLPARCIVFLHSSRKTHQNHSRNQASDKNTYPQRVHRKHRTSPNLPRYPFRAPPYRTTANEPLMRARSDAREKHIIPNRFSPLGKKDELILVLRLQSEKDCAAHGAGLAGLTEEPFIDARGAEVVLAGG